MHQFDICLHYQHTTLEFSCWIEQSADIEVHFTSTAKINFRHSSTKRKRVNGFIHYAQVAQKQKSF